MSRRWRYPRTRRGAFYGPLQASGVQAAPSYPPAFQEPSGRAARLAGMRSPRGRFFMVTRTACPPPRQARRSVVRLASVRQGRFLAVPLVGAPPTIASWMPAPLDPARRAPARTTRRGRFYTVPLVGAAPAVAPWVPPALDPARRASARPTRHGKFFAIPLVGAAPIAAPWVPLALDPARRQPARPARRGRFFTIPLPGAPGAIPRPAWSRVRTLFNRRGHFWTPPLTIPARWIPLARPRRRANPPHFVRVTFIEPIWSGPAVPPGDFNLFGRIRPNLVLGAIRPNQIHGDIRGNRITGDVRPNQIIGGNSVARTLSPGSVEVIWAEVTFLGLTAAGIAGITAEIAFSSTDTPGAWQAPDATTREDLTGYDAARLSVSKSVTAALLPGETSSTYRVWARLSDGTIVPCEQYTVR